MRIRYIQGVWDYRNRDPKYKFDQDYLEIDATSDGLMLEHERDSYMIRHSDNGKDQIFFVQPYYDGSVISFVHHSADLSKNETGFGGRTFQYTIDGVEYNVPGPWSSGEYHFNELVPVQDHTTHAALYDGRYELTGMAVSIRVSRVLEMIREQNLPYSLVRGLGVRRDTTYEIVHNDDLEEFIRNGGIHPIFVQNHIERGVPVIRWSGQTEDSLQRQILQVKVLS